MRKTLQNPELPPGAIVETFEDGGALRNDGVKLTPAAQNPWYVLATVYGEQEAGNFDEDLQKRNRHAWNYICIQQLKKEKTRTTELCGFLNLIHSTYVHEWDAQTINDIGSALEQRSGVTFEELKEFQAISFSAVHFSKPLFLEGYFFPKPLIAKSCLFSDRVKFRSSWFDGGLDFRGFLMKEACSFSASRSAGSLILADGGCEKSLWIDRCTVPEGMLVWNTFVKRQFRLDGSTFGQNLELEGISADTIRCEA